MIFQGILQWQHIRQSPPECQNTPSTTYGEQLHFGLHTHLIRRCHTEDLSLFQVSLSASWQVTTGTCTREPGIKHEGLCLLSTAGVAQRTITPSPCTWRCHSRSPGPRVLTVETCSSLQMQDGLHGPTGITLSFSSSQL